METKVAEISTDDNSSLNSSTASLDLEEDFTEEEIKKAEEFKTKGNEAFKSKDLVDL